MFEPGPDYVSQSFMPLLRSLSPAGRERLTINMALLTELGRPPVPKDPCKVQSKLGALQTLRAVGDREEPRGGRIFSINAAQQNGAELAPAFGGRAAPLESDKAKPPHLTPGLLHVVGAATAMQKAPLGAPLLIVAPATSSAKLRQAAAWCSSQALTDVASPIHAAPAELTARPGRDNDYKHGCSLTGAWPTSNAEISV